VALKSHYIVSAAIALCKVTTSSGEI